MAEQPGYYDEAETRAHLFGVMPAEMTNASGTQWVLTPGDRFDRDPRHKVDDARAFLRRTFRRITDGFEIAIARHGNSRVEASVSWPTNPYERSFVRSDAAAPQFMRPYQPRCTFTMEREPADIARHVLRKLVLPEYVTAFHEIAKHWEDNETSRAQAGEWIAGVAEAAGVPFTRLHGSVHFRTDGTWTSEIKADTTNSGGQITITLPRGPKGAAAMVRRLRAAVEA
jgi:hypothetical protein